MSVQIAEKWGKPMFSALNDDKVLNIRSLKHESGFILECADDFYRMGIVLDREEVLQLSHFLIQQLGDGTT